MWVRTPKMTYVSILGAQLDLAHKSQKRRSMTRHVLTAFLLSTLAACSAEEVGMDGDVAPDAGTSEVETAVELEVDAPDASTHWDSIPVTGHGPANGTLIYTTAGGGQHVEALGATGDFCVDVLLSKDQNNTIKFEAVNSAGVYSEPILVDVRQAGEPPETETDTDTNTGYTNIAYGATIEDMSVGIDDDGDVAALVDGDTSAHITVRNSVLHTDWMVVELNERLPIEQIKIQTTEDCPMDHFKILLSDDADSADPVFNGISYPPSWVTVAEVSVGVPIHVVQPNLGQPRARRMAIEFLSGDCSSIIENGRHRIKEIEVWAVGERDPGEPGSDGGAPSCSSF